MLCLFYLRRGIVYLPTLALTEGGLYGGVEPVAVVPVSNTNELIRAFHETIARGHPHIPDMRRDEFPEPVVLKYAGAKNWSEFQRGATTWKIKDLAGPYQIVSQRKIRGATVEDHDNTVTFPLGTNLGAVLERMVAILQGRASAKTEAPSTVLGETMTAAPLIGAEIPTVPRVDPNPFPLPAGWLHLPDGERIDELGDFLEWLANATRADEAAIRAEIGRYYFRVGDVIGGKALDHALGAVMAEPPGSPLRAQVLRDLEPLTRSDPAEVSQAGRLLGGFALMRWALRPPKA